MKYYFAPMEGLTGYVYRSGHANYFTKADKYFTPFISPNQKRQMRSKETNDVLPEHNQGLYLVPQLLGNRADEMIDTIHQLEQMGYQEVNLNLGCPSGTVVAKGKGSGFLAKTDELDRFLEEVYSKINIAMSIKTRIGKYDGEEMFELMEIYNQYPVLELIIHPRIQKQQYQGKPDYHIFEEARKQSKWPVCYNGDLFTKTDFQKFQKQFPEVDCVMMGRGLAANPELIGVFKGEKKLSKEQIWQFYQYLLKEYQMVLSGEVPVLHKMKEAWHYMASSFTENEKYVKQMKRAKHLSEFQETVETMFVKCRLKD